MLTDILLSIDWTQLIIFIMTSVGGALMIRYRKRFPVWRKMWRGVFDGLQTIPDLERTVQGIRYYVSPNGGGSLADAIKRTEQKIEALSEQVDLVAHTMWVENDSDDNIGRFHCNATGENTYVNQIYARWLGVGKTELLGWKYLNFIHTNDIERVRRQWDLCRTENRQYKNRHYLVSADGESFEVEVIATPIPETTPTKRWVGTIRRIDVNNI